ncbi:hypothetical protein T4B_12260 [Trichinella pseudospiralis]|uniref:Uncharacterized protein n=1 Tax=Trichinella pseudospiralis TaxID=6337 RepID=A0A0V1JFV9_TRIPS|nr:hypothetical protein T4A_13886 [Trichinella pseudospiralis]KRZ33841.1 hypothetical protein T4B_12260 [Trichinella pseudospiralis]
MGCKGALLLFKGSFLSALPAYWLSCRHLSISSVYTFGTIIWLPPSLSVIPLESQYSGPFASCILVRG